MNEANQILFFLLTLVAEIIGTIGGFGSSVFFVPFANIFFDFHTVLGITAIFHLSSNLSKIYLFKNALNKKLLLTMGIPSVVFVIIGGLLTKIIASNVLEILLGFFLIALSGLFLWKDQLIIPTNNYSVIQGGIYSGLMAGLLGTGGAIRGITMAAFNLEKSVFVATSASIDMGIDLTRSVVYYQNGYIQADIWKYVPLLFAIGFLGSWIGQKILQRIPQVIFRKISLYFILLIGLFTCFQWVWK